MDGVPIAEAAERLGISVAAVRQRIRRGTLAAVKGEDDRWYIRIPVEEYGVRDTVESTVSSREDMTYRALLEEKDERISLLQRELDSRNRELQDRAREVEQLHVLLQSSQQNEQRLLSATVPDAPYREPSGQYERSGDDESRAQTPNVAPGGAERVPRASAEPRRRGWVARLLGWE